MTGQDKGRGVLWVFMRHCQAADSKDNWESSVPGEGDKTQQGSSSPQSAEASRGGEERADS